MDNDSKCGTLVGNHHTLCWRLQWRLLANALHIELKLRENIFAEIHITVIYKTLDQESMEKSSIQQETYISSLLLWLRIFHGNVMFDCFALPIENASSKTSSYTQT